MGLQTLEEFVRLSDRIRTLRFGGDLQNDGRVIAWVRIWPGKRIKHVFAAGDSNVAEVISAMAAAAIAGALRSERGG